jgi:hypothetical protein
VSDNDHAPEALFGHCVSVYEEMLKTAKVVPLYDQEDTDEVVVWEGMLTTLITSKLNLSVPYYTSITRALKRMGCIRQIKRGGGTAPSQWELIREPTIELFDESKPLKAKPQDKYSLMQEQLNSQNSRLLRLERVLEKIIQEQEEIHG